MPTASWRRRCGGRWGWGRRAQPHAASRDPAGRGRRRGASGGGRHRLPGALRLASRRALLPGGVASPGARLCRLPAADRAWWGGWWCDVFGTSLDALRLASMLFALVGVADGGAVRARAGRRAARAGGGGAGVGDRSAGAERSQPVPPDHARHRRADDDALPGAAGRHQADAAAVAGGGRRRRRGAGGQVHDRHPAAGAAGRIRADAAAVAASHAAGPGSRSPSRRCCCAEPVAGRSTTAGPAPRFASSQRAQTADDTPPPAYVAEAVAFLAAGSAAGGGRRRLDVAAAAASARSRGRPRWWWPGSGSSRAAPTTRCRRWWCAWPPARSRSSAGGRPRRWPRPAARWRRWWPSSCWWWRWSPSWWCRCGQRRAWSTRASGRTPSTRTRSAGRSWPRRPRPPGGRCRAADRRDGAILAENYGEARRAGAVRAGAGAAAAAVRPPQLAVLAAVHGCRSASARRRLRPVGAARLLLGVHVLARIDNRWRLDNEERGRTIAACTLRRPLGAIWDSEIARDQL